MSHMRMAAWAKLAVLAICGATFVFNGAAAEENAEEITFQAGRNGYDGVRDVCLWGRDFGGSFWDSKTFSIWTRDRSWRLGLDIEGTPESGGRKPGLICFSNIFGDGPNQIRSKARILSARLLLYQLGATCELDAETQRRPARLHAFVMSTPFYTVVEKAGSGSTNGPPAEGWSCFAYRQYFRGLPVYWGKSNAIELGPVKGIDYESSPVAKAEVIPSERKLWLTFEVTSAVRKWADGTVPNNGLYIYANTPSLNTQFYSSDCGKSSLRPKLVVNYAR